MSRSSFTRRVALAASAIAATAAAFPIVHATAAAPAKTQSCSITVVGQQDNGQFITTPMSCTTGGVAMAAALFPIAVHYLGLNFTGSTLTIYGDGCNNGWLNMPAGWQNNISSTYSGCIVDHYDGINLIPAIQTLYSPGNLTTLDNKTNSAVYR
ncbi:MAG: hypothetical protein AB7V43_01640 [Acidimicrobiia bacterium]